MGHASVTTTEVYSNMNLKRVAQDFPSLIDKKRNKGHGFVGHSTFDE